MARVKLPDGRIVNADSVDKLIGLKKTTSFKKSDSRSVRATAASKSHSLSSIKSAKKTQSALLKHRKSHADEHHTAGSDCLSRSNRRGESHKGQHLNQWSETNMLGALNEWRLEGNASPSQKRRPLRELSRAWDIPYATFRRRIMSSAVNRHAGHLSGRPTVLSKAAEEELATHLRNLASAGFPCDRTDVKNLAFDYAARNEIKGFSTQKKTAGYYWFKGFMRRHGDLVMKKAILFCNHFMNCKYRPSLGLHCF